MREPRYVRRGFESDIGHLVFLHWILDFVTLCDLEFCRKPSFLDAMFHLRDAAAAPCFAADVLVRGSASYPSSPSPGRLAGPRTKNRPTFANWIEREDRIDRTLRRPRSLRRWLAAPIPGTWSLFRASNRSIEAPDRLDAKKAACVSSEDARPYIARDVGPSMLARIGAEQLLGMVHRGIGFEQHTVHTEEAGGPGQHRGVDVECCGIEWMASGKGVWHMASAVGRTNLKGFQVWLLLPPGADMRPPASIYLDAEDVPGKDGVRVILGSWEGLDSPVEGPPETTLLDVTMSAGASWTFTPPTRQQLCWLAVHKGGVHVGHDVARAGELLIFEDGVAALQFETSEGACFIIGSAQRSPYPLHIGNHSVHLSAEALAAGEAEIERLRIENHGKGIF